MKKTLLIVLGCLVLIGCGKSNSNKMKITKYEQSEEGYVFYISAVCFDYPMGKDSSRVFRDGTLYEMRKEGFKNGAKYFDWDDYNEWCREYLKIKPEKEIIPVPDESFDEKTSFGREWDGTLMAGESIRVNVKIPRGEIE